MGLALAIRNVAPEYETFGILSSIILILLGSFFGAFIFQLIWVNLLWLSGKIFQGKAQKEHIRIILAFACLPYVIDLFFVIVILILSIINNEFEVENFYVNNLSSFIVWILMIRFLILGLSRAQKFSYIYAVFSILIPSVALSGIIVTLIKIIHSNFV